MKTMRGPWTVLEQREAYDSPWIRVEHHEVLTPKATPGMYGLVHFKNTAIGVLVLDEALNTWIVGQYRYPLEAYSWEIPEGGGPLNEPPLAAAQRELKEETGIVAKEWMPIQEMHLSNSVSDEYGIIYLARQLSFYDSEPEDSEELEVKKLPFKELYQMVLEGKVTDSLTVAAVLKVQLMLLEGKIK